MMTKEGDKKNGDKKKKNDKKNARREEHSPELRRLTTELIICKLSYK